MCIRDRPNRFRFRGDELGKLKSCAKRNRSQRAAASVCLVLALGFAAFALKHPIVLYVLPSGRRSRFLLHRKHKAFVGSWCVEGTRTRLCEIRRTTKRCASCVHARSRLPSQCLGRPPAAARGCVLDFLRFYFPGLTSDQSGKLIFLKNLEAFVREWLCKVTL